MLKIRLQRVGRKHEPSFRLVLTDSKNSTKSGKTLETLGNYDSRRGHDSVFNAERITHWLGLGAQASETVHNLLVEKKIIEGKKINNLPLKKAIIKEKTEEKAEEKIEEETIETPTEEAPVAEETSVVEEIPTAETVA